MSGYSYFSKLFLLTKCYNIFLHRYRHSVRDTYAHFRLLTLFRMKRRFRDVFGTAVILYPRLVSAMIVLMLTYYFFAIIGMECFHNVVLFECCKYVLLFRR